MSEIQKTCQRIRRMSAWRHDENSRPPHWMPRQDDLVYYHSIIGGPVTSGPHLVRLVDTLPHGIPVVWLTGKVGCVACDAVTPAQPVEVEVGE
jgi:hypothetical protein